MGQYRLSVYTERSFGLWVGYDRQPKMIKIKLPFTAIFIGLEKHANGYNFLGVKGR